MDAGKIELNTTQKRVIDYLVEFGSITTLQAFVDLGETRLSARIFELRKKGIPRSGTTIKVKNRLGEARHIKEYKIG